jgi:hypothetical protein
LELIMGWTSHDDMINQMTVNGKADSHIYQKTLVAAGTAGHWQHLLTSAGNIPAATFGGAEATYVETTNAWAEGALPIADQTLPATKHLTTAGASVIAAAGAPWFVQLIDLHGYAKLTTTNVSTTGAKVITMTPIAAGASTYDRYPNGDGLRIAVAAIAAMGANAPTMQVTYTNQAGTAGRVTLAGCVSTASATNGTILNSGNAANKYGPFLPLAAGDSGVRDIESLTWGGTAHASGSVAVLLCKPLGSPIPIPASGLYSVFDYVNTLPSFPRLRNGANLTALVYNTGATTSGGTFFMAADYGWGG